MQKIPKIILKYVLPLAILVYILSMFRSNAALAALMLAVYLAVVVFLGRARIFTLLGSMNYSKGDLDKAVEWMGKAYRSGKAKPTVVISYAYLLLKSGNIEEPEKILSKLLNSPIDSADKMVAKSNYALVLWKKGSLDEAVALLEEVYRDYKTTTIYGSLGYMLILKGDLVRALELNLEAYEYNSSNAIIADNLGQTYYLREEYDKAKEIYEKLIPTNPTFPEAYYNFGLLLEAVDEWERGIEQMRKALNYKFTFLSTVTREEVEAKLQELEGKLIQ